MNDRVRIDIDALGVAEVRLVRGDKMNALDPAMFSALTEALAELREAMQAERPKVRWAVDVDPYDFG